MRKSIYCGLILLLLASCVQKGWNEVQRQSLERMLYNRAHTPAMDPIDTTIYSNAVRCTVVQIQQIYPSFSKFKADTLAPMKVSETLVNCLAENIGDDFENLRFVLPYNQLVEMGVLASGLTTIQQKAFYNCLGSRANQVYGTPRRFVHQLTKDVSVNLLNHKQIKVLIAECCSELSIDCPMIAE